MSYYFKYNYNYVHVHNNLGQFTNGEEKQKQQQQFMYFLVEVLGEYDILHLTGQRTDASYMYKTFDHKNEILVRNFLSQTRI